MSVYDPGPRNEDGEPIDPHYEERNVKKDHPIISFIGGSIGLAWVAFILYGVCEMIDLIIKK